MSHNLIEPTPSAYAYPLLIKTLLGTALTNSPDQQIVFADRLRYDYRTFHDRIRRLASALSDLGVRHGDTVGRRPARVEREGSGPAYGNRPSTNPRVHRPGVMGI